MSEEKVQVEKIEEKKDPRMKLIRENEKQKQAFDLYYGMGDKRTIEAVANTIGMSSRTVGEWSRKFQWKDRVNQREIEDATAQGGKANAVIDTKAEYRQIIRALVASFVKDYKDGKIKIKNIQDFERIVKLDLMLLGDAQVVEVKNNVELSDDDRKAIFAVADSIKAEMNALKSK